MNVKLFPDEFVNILTGFILSVTSQIIVLFTSSVSIVNWLMLFKPTLSILLKLISLPSSFNFLDPLIVIKFKYPSELKFGRRYSIFIDGVALAETLV